MTRFKDKIIAAGVIFSMAFGLVACKGSSDQKQTDPTQAATQAESESQTEEKEITVMYDSSIISKDDSTNEFYDQIQKLTGLKIQWKPVEHNDYGKTLESVFSSDETIPDIVLLPENYYKIYAYDGYLWNMSQAWDKSQTKNNYKLNDDSAAFIDSLKTNGSDGTPGLYGFSPVRPDENVTVIKKSWLTKAGIDPLVFQNGQLDYNTYYGYLKTMSSVNLAPAVKVPAIIADDAPYTQYLPEFFQQAKFSFYKNTVGQYADGFSEKEMRDSLERIKQAVDENIISVESGSFNEYTDNFTGTDTKKTSGAISFKTGAGLSQLKEKLAQNQDELIEAAPVKENGAYTENAMSYWCITTAAKNPQELFDTFIDTMLDNGKTQQAWETTAGIISPSAVLNKEEKKSDNTDSSRENENTDKTDDKTDTDTLTDDSSVYMSNTCENIPATREYTSNILKINEIRKYVVNQVVSGKMSIDDGMSYYQNQAGTLVDEVLKSLNEGKSVQ